MGDRIEAGTLLMACGIAGGEIELVGARLEHLEIVVMKLGEMGMRVSPTPDGIWARADDRMRAVDVATLPFPGFATDFMPLAVALLAVAEGTAIVTENVFDGRFQFVDELNRMGADVRHEGRHAVVRGVERLSGAPVRALDVRAGAALVLAGLAADGETVVHDASTSTAATPTSPARLRALGADVERVRDCRPSRPRDDAVAAGSPAILGGVRERSTRRCRSTRDLDPAEQKQQVLEAIDSIRPALQSDGGDIVFRELDDDGVVHVTLVGACGTCPVSMMTLKAGVERIIMDRVPGVTEVVADSESSEPRSDCRPAG